MKSNDCLAGIDGMNFASLDLNLLRVFDAMAAECNTTRVGARVGLSQPAVSAALNRLRHATGDALFVREGNRMVPTPRAEAMAAPVRAALAAIERTLAAPGVFDPARATRGFRLLGQDYFSTLVMPRLAALAEAEAPGVVLQMLDLAGGPAANLAEGRVDLCLDIARSVPEWVESERLYRSDLVGAAAKGHPGLAGVAPGATIPAEVYAGLRHAIVSGDGSARGTVDAALEAVGLRRRVVLTLPHFHAVALAAADSSVVASLPQHFARAVAPRLGLELYRLPVPAPAVEIHMFWHSRDRLDPASLWLRTGVRAASAAVSAAVFAAIAAADPIPPVTESH